MRSDDLAVLVYRLNPPAFAGGMVAKAGDDAKIVQSHGDNTHIDVR